MSKKYNGVCAIYLQGENALEISNESVDCMVYNVGEESSNIVVKDYRVSANKAAIDAGKTDDMDTFLIKFNEVAEVVAEYDEDFAKIELYDSKEKETFNTLWLGSIDNGSMGVNKIVWEVLKPIGDKYVAFVSVIEEHINA